MKKIYCTYLFMLLFPSYMIAADFSEESSDALVNDAQILANSIISQKNGLHEVLEYIEDYSSYKKVLFLNCFQECGHALKDSATGIFLLAFYYEKRGFTDLAIKHYAELINFVREHDNLVSLCNKIVALNSVDR